jgi:hypothetical protein
MANPAETCPSVEVTMSRNEGSHTSPGNNLVYDDAIVWPDMGGHVLRQGKFLDRSHFYSVAYLPFNTMLVSSTKDALLDKIM